jgi:hypothetical protein
LEHHAVCADVEIAAVWIAGDDAVGGAGVTAAIERPVARNRQLCQVDLVAGQGILKETGVVGFDFRGIIRFSIILHAANQFHGRYRAVLPALEQCAECSGLKYSTVTVPCTGSLA